MTDALERLRRQRPSVPARTADIQALESSPKVQISTYPDIQISTPPDIQTAQNPTSFEVKQTTLRLEKTIAQELATLCQQEGICREVLVEALWIQAQGQADVLKTVLPLAQERQQQRFQVANQKRAKAMADKFTAKSED